MMIKQPPGIHLKSLLIWCDKLANRQFHAYRKLKLTTIWVPRKIYSVQFVWNIFS
ncbi:hypothetical protein OIU77_006813 [Salix suchowensis]|uniref:Uncharacterized protein n=1 Tax=Salix suchowensis TaxID=1278906 RepID=A0ABQ9AM00_9ROSI|nr:hypothetical protein OIU77_006813 [Salix suchowensis]KAJ6349300.1 hypothetical protein OIU77_006813 [Salix suchowensis]KAJ6349301.1 hypothetical protein OIU77_006813 [Salix suchowensis]